MRNLKILLSSLLLVVIATSWTYAQKQTITNKTYPIQSFTSVESDVVGNVIYTQSNIVSARAEGDEELVDKLRITAKNGVLSIGHEGKFTSKKKQKLTIFISSPFIELIDVEGVGNWYMDGRVKANYLKIKFDGVGNFEALDLESSNINADYEGVGNLLLGGTTDLIEIKSEGVGNINTQNLKAKRAIVESSGVGSVKCYASVSINLVNRGVGSITYFGDPKLKNMKNSGIGKIKAGK